MPFINQSRRLCLGWLGGLSLGALLSRLAGAQPASPARGLVDRVLPPGLRGKAAFRGVADYEEQRRFSVWQALKPERFPEIIVRAETEADIIDTVNFARERKLPLAVKGSGHSFVASHLRTGGIMLDVSQLRGLEIDAAARMAYVGPGLRSGEFAQLLAQQDLAFPVPHGVSVALGGYLLGGGMGWNNEAWNNFSCFNIEAVEMILASGEKIVASREAYSDLFWAARGGGPTFCAVVTRFHLRVFALPKAITACTHLYPIEALGAVSKWLENIHPQHHARVELSLILQKDKKTPGAATAGEPYCIVSAVCFADSEVEARVLLGRVLGNAPAEGRVVVNDHKPMNFAELLELSRILAPQRMANETAWVDDTGAAMRRLGEHMLGAPEQSEIALIMNFRAKRELPGDAAYSALAAMFINFAAMWERPSDDEANLIWLDAAVDSIKSLTVAAYINESDFFRRPERSRLYMRQANWQRLAGIYRQYDPQGLFPPPLPLPY